METNPEAPVNVSTINTSETNMKNRSLSDNLYEQSNQYAQEASGLADKAYIIAAPYHLMKEHLRLLDELISPVKMSIWFIFLILICVCEYFFSLPLYRHFIPAYPAIPALGIISVSLILAHSFVLMINKSAVDWRKEELKAAKIRRVGGRRLKVEEFAKIDKRVRNEKNSEFYIGFSLFIIIGIVITRLSIERVDYLIKVGEQEKFLVQDTLPVVFYVFEVLSGLYFVSLIIRLIRGLQFLSIKANFNRNQSEFLELAEQSQLRTDEAIQLFNRTLESGYDIWNTQTTISQCIQEAYYRYNKNAMDKFDYIRNPIDVDISLRLVIIDSNTHAEMYGNFIILTNNYKRFSNNAGISFEQTIYQDEEIKSFKYDNRDPRNLTQKFKNGENIIKQYI